MILTRKCNWKLRQLYLGRYSHCPWLLPLVARNVGQHTDWACVTEQHYQRNFRLSISRSEIVPKTHNSIKQTKKKPLLTAKEKRVAKHAKKQQENAVVPLITH